MELDLFKRVIKTFSLKQLREAKSIIDKLYKEKKSQKSRERLVDTHRNQFGVYFRLEKVYCNKSNCSKCNKEKKGHGPYWYSYKNGVRKYIGKKNIEDLNEIRGLSSKINQNLDNKLPYKK